MLLILHISFPKGCILNLSCIIPPGLRKKRCFKMERHLEQDNAFHISDLALCLAAYNTCIIIMRLLIHHGEYKAILVPCHHYGMFKVFSQAFLSECGGRGGGGVVNSILSISNKQLVTLKFDTSAICFLLSGETIFFLKFKAVSNTPSFLSILLGSQGGQ